ncbi:hypothetical protein CLV78_102388 [Aliiruegeria haliotis]|uniref:DUF4412 domain-containing protein n=1 Tax=Aliiruegeria haliotis TaxID=1280846 RepID=A0A2T0RVK7_9RHOB|nr:hypothetical protein [Aliiruegeria haliotis]PRY25211.1 hypothetical protein CLV78_102388 [Aliiruegeria haliotis]
MRAPLISALLFALPAAGAETGAECPTRSALEAGESAYVTYPDSSIVALKWIGEGMVQETTRYPDGDGDFRMISMGGVFIIDEVDMDGDREMGPTRISTRYPPDMFDRVPLSPEQEFKVVAVNRFADGTESEEEYLSVQTGNTAEVMVGACSYTAFPVLITYRWQGGEFTSMLSHLPTLGLSVEMARIDEGTDPEPFAPHHFTLAHP